jgi:hypothetical protein
VGRIEGGPSQDAGPSPLGVGNPRSLTRSGRQGRFQCCLFRNHRRDYDGGGPPKEKALRPGNRELPVGAAEKGRSGRSASCFRQGPNSRSHLPHYRRIRERRLRRLDPSRHHSSWCAFSDRACAAACGLYLALARHLGGMETAPFRSRRPHFDLLGTVTPLSIVVGAREGS